MGHYNPEKRAWRGRSYRSRKNIRAMRETARPEEGEMSKKLYVLKLSAAQARIVHELLCADGASDYIGKETDLPWDEVYEAGIQVGMQLEQQKCPLDGDFRDEDE